MKGISPLVAVVLVIAFGFAAMTITMTVVNPLLDRAKDSGIINEATQNMQLIDSTIKAVASEARGSKRTLLIKITEGVLRTNATSEQILLEYDPRTRTILDGFFGDVKIESRPIFLEYFNQYLSDANANRTWTSLNGTWSVSSGRFLGTGGIAYRNVGNQSSFDIAATIVKSSAPDGQMYVIPGDPRDLLLYIPFDGNVNTTITTAYDYSAYKYNGTLANGTAATCYTNNACPDWVSGRFGNGTEFDGLGDTVNVTASDPLFAILNGTFAVWVKFRGSGLANCCGAGVGDGYIASMSRDNGGADNRWMLANVSGTILLSWDIQDSNINIDSGVTVQPNRWYHVAYTFNNASGVKLYVDGVERASNANTLGWAHIPAADRDPLSIGRDFDGGVNGGRMFLNGTIDEVMVFSRTLTANEIAFLFESSRKKITTGGEIPTIAEDANVTIVLAAPGSSYFDNVKLKSGGTPKIHFLVPYQNIDIVNNTKFGPGDHNIVIRHYGVNTTVNRPMIGLEE